jgi:hypothetical protein
MKNIKINVVIVHGWSADPTCNWFPWLKQTLEEDGIECVVPAMPNPERPVLAEWVEHLRHTIESRVPSPETRLILIGHSLGCVTICHYLERVQNARADGCIFVAGFSGNIRILAIKEFYETPVDLAGVRTKIGKSISILSLNDKAVPAQRSREFAAGLGAELVEVNGYGHFMGSEGVTKLPMILPEIQKLI